MLKILADLILLKGGVLVRYSPVMFISTTHVNFMQKMKLTATDVQEMSQ